jgi:predicted O-methyltransferase YrrM
MDVEKLIGHPPLLHADRAGKAVSWRAGDHLLRYLDASVREGDATLETGAGLSTLVFAMNRCRHTAVVPDQGQADRILEWCAHNEVPSDTLRFEIAPSETALPNLEQTPLDLVLIDGAHGFPLPFLDWFYAGRRLRAGGIVVVDDVQIWTGRVLQQILDADAQWSVEHQRHFEFFAARRVADGPVGEWTEQPYVLHRSFTPGSSSTPRRLIGDVVIGAELARSTASLMRRGQWGEVRHRLDSFRHR